MLNFRWSSGQFLGIAIVLLTATVSAFAQDSKDSSTEQGKSQMLELWKSGDSGQRMRIRGRVTNTDGSPIPNVHIRLRHADSEGVNRSYFRGELFTNDRGVYQFGSVIPGNEHRLSHVHVLISHPDYKVLDTEFYFKSDPKANPDDPNAIFLEEGNANGEKLMYGRWDITLTPK